MANATVDVIAPRALIVPDGIDHPQQVSGAIWISGATLCFTRHDGTDTPVVLS